MAADGDGTRKSEKIQKDEREQSKRDLIVSGAHDISPLSNSLVLSTR